jgi:hypothetical protein
MQAHDQAKETYDYDFFFLIFLFDLMVLLSFCQIFIGFNRKF